MSHRSRSSLRPVSSSHHPAASGATGVPKPHLRPAQLYPTPAAGADYVPTPCVNVPGNVTSQVVIDPIYTKLVVVHGQAPGSTSGAMRSSLTGVIVVLPGVGRETRRHPRRVYASSSTAASDPATPLIEPMPATGADQDVIIASRPDYGASPPTSGRTVALRPDFDGQGLRLTVAADAGPPALPAEYAGKEEVEVRNETLGMIFVRASPSNGMTWAIGSGQTRHFSHGHTGWTIDRRN